MAERFVFFGCGEFAKMIHFRPSCASGRYRRVVLSAAWTVQQRGYVGYAAAYGMDRGGRSGRGSSLVVPGRLGGRPRPFLGFPHSRPASRSRQVRLENRPSYRALQRSIRLNPSRRSPVHSRTLRVSPCFLPCSKNR